MRQRLIVLALSLFVVLPATAAVTGVVMTTDGQPIAGAKVESFALETLDATRARLLSATPDRTLLTSGQTDAKGRFTLESPKDPVVQLRVTAKGYAPAAYRIERDEDVGAVALTAAEMKTGRITANGKPVAGAKVLGSGAGDVIATTDAEGRYSLPDPAKAGGVGIVIHPDFAILDDNVFRGPGQSSTALDRTLSAGVPLSGTVVGEDGKTPVAGATLSIEGWPVATSGQDGTFSVAHAPAKWQLVVARSGNLIGTRARAASSSGLVVKLGKSATLSGALRDMKTQAPIAGADVRLRAPMRIDASETWSALTDAKGNFTITGIVPGSYQVSASRPGYGFAPISVSLTTNEKVNKSIIGAQLARVAGTVVDESKHPVAAARISSQAVSRGGDPLAMMMMRTGAPSAAVSGPDGTFAVRAEPDMDVQIDALKKGYPGAKSSTMHFSPGERKSGLVLTIPSGMMVTGRVTDKNGKPLSGVSVGAGEATGGFNNTIRRVVMGARNERNDDLIKTANDGTFGIRVKEGTYDLAFKRDGFAAKSLRAVHVNSSTKPLEVTLEPGVEITGRVTRGGNGVEGVRISAFGENGLASDETQLDGSFRLTDLSPGQMMLNATKEEEFIQQIRPVNAPAADLKIEVPPGGQVRGRVFDKETNQPITAFEAGVSTPRGGGGMVIMMPPAMRHFTADDGTFVLENVPAGSTQIIVNAPGYTTARMPNVNVEEGKTIADLDVAMEHGVRLLGHVTGPDGALLAGVSVRLDQTAGRVMRPGPMQNNSTVTDGNGDYSIEALESGDKTFVFTRSGYLTAEKPVTLSGTETRLDVQLSNGMRVSGNVTTDSGVPVADARVMAVSGATTGFGQPSTMTDANGNFTFEGLAAGHYRFTAAKQGLANGELLDFDISSGAPVRLVMKSGGIIYGHVGGLTPDELQQTTVTASSSSGGGSAPVDASGNFRMEGAPTGTVRVAARIGMGISGGKTSPMQSVQVDAGAPVQVDIEFKSNTVIRGRVTRNGSPVEGAMVMFMPKESQAQTSARASTQTGGTYEVSGLDDATYNVGVTDLQRGLVPFATTYQVRGSGTFDIDMKSAALRGRVMDSNGNPVAEAVVEVREKTAATDFRMSMRTIQTDGSGLFVLDNVPPGTYSLTAEKQGYGTKAVDATVDDNGGSVEITLSPNAGVTLRVVDGRDGRLLNARVHVTDAAGAGVYDSPFMGGSADVVKLPLEAGTYRAVISAFGYASQTITLTSPSTPTIGLTPGGSIAVQSKGSALRRARLIGADGKTYFSMGPGIFTIDPSPGVTILNNIAPGVYTLQILGSGSEVTASTPVTIVEGQQAAVQI
ncbi:MAG TPA: carboxypeptidase-like regulatory domain-containing protein [Thermoanaerobaculia bacterium]|nr:carboxypeptidase-like regulatory domain-containing protein [Thermoanaerobaculia bacterium]